MNEILRFQFSRDEGLRFLSHLDLQRLFQRAFRRGKIPTAFSEGFNPHIKLSFAGALPLGMITEGEYGDIVLTEKMPLKDFVKTMNGVMPPGLRIIAAQYISPKTPSLSASLVQADYEIRLFDQMDAPADEVLSQACEHFMTAETIMIQKRNKKKQMIDADIRPYLAAFAFEGREANDLLFELSIRYINQKCVKPIQVMQAFNDMEALNLQVDESMVLKRTKMILK